MMESDGQVFLLNVGNSNVQYARCCNGRIGEIYQVSRHNFKPEVIPERSPVAIACVAPEFMPQLDAFENIFKVSPGISCGIDFSNCDISTLGADRLANVITLAETGLLPAVCIDFGTAITFDVLAPGKIFLGGAIMPGRMLQRKSLNDFTAQLPLIEFYDDIPDLGECTVDAIRVGVDDGVIGGVERIIEKVRKMFPVDNLRIVATGGDSDFFLKYIPGLEAAGNDCTLYGINKAWEYYINES
jgi:type III pantothenate kinase